MLSDYHMCVRSSKSLVRGLLLVPPVFLYGRVQSIFRSTKVIHLADQEFLVVQLDQEVASKS
jgi:hypothetical protein